MFLLPQDLTGTFTEVSAREDQGTDQGVLILQTEDHQPDGGFTRLTHFGRVA